MLLIPPINTKGSFVFAPPFDKIIDMSREYTVTGMRSLVELFNNGEKPFDMIYKPVGLTETDFNNDVINNVPIIVLSTEGCDFLYVPANRITSIPMISGVKYVEKILSLSLGNVPLDLDLTLLSNTIVDVAYEIVGIKATVTENRSSSVFLVTESEDTIFRTLMKNRASVDKSYKTKYEELKLILAEKDKKITMLETCIKKNINKLKA